MGPPCERRAGLPTLLLSVQLLGATLDHVVAPPPRQPKTTYVKVPEVPAPPTFAITEFLVNLSFEALDRNADGGCDEIEFTEAIEEASVDDNDDGQLDVEELERNVARHRRSKGKFAAPAQSWPFLHLLASKFETLDLSRQARFAVTAMQDHVAVFLKSVPFLDERRGAFDAIAGAEVANDLGAFLPEAWRTWRQRQAEEEALRKAKRRRRSARRKQGRGAAQEL
eukprot:TRINITY_DN10110_c0_g1_i1.p1 TRINITY_DN10110_c0_g1~~TRINITY_DN10110_c0_g1_i1.p1  ORF type:complete len:244 (+),score=55.52 TRINITY_DN10110_c0_g1_i1:60-734(+)